jgi:hypothetical protein
MDLLFNPTYSYTPDTTWEHVKHDSLIPARFPEQSVVIPGV